jgi:hypothetical protein
MTFPYYCGVIVPFFLWPLDVVRPFALELESSEQKEGQSGFGLAHGERLVCLAEYT